MGCLGSSRLLRLPVAVFDTRFQLEAGSELILSGRGSLWGTGKRTTGKGVGLGGLKSWVPYLTPSLFLPKMFFHLWAVHGGALGGDKPRKFKVGT